MGYGKKISLAMAAAQKNERDDLKDQMKKKCLFAISHFNDIKSQEKALKLYMPRKKTQGFVFDKTLLTDFIAAHSSAEQFAIIEVSELDDDDFPNIDSSLKTPNDGGARTAAIIAIKETSKGSGKFEVVRADTSKPLGNPKNPTGMEDADALEHPGTPITINWPTDPLDTQIKIMFI